MKSLTLINKKSINSFPLFQIHLARSEEYKSLWKKFIKERKLYKYFRNKLKLNKD